MSSALSVPPWPGYNSENSSRDYAFSRAIFSGTAHEPERYSSTMSPGISIAVLAVLSKKLKKT